MEESKKNLFVAVNSARFASDALDSDLLAEHRAILTAVLAINSKTGEMMSKSAQIDLGLPDQPCTAYDIEVAYLALIESNKRKRQTELFALAGSTDDIEALTAEIFAKYRISFGGEERRLTLRCHDDFVAAIRRKLSEVDDYLKSGYPTIDRMIGGGYRPGSIYLWQGLSGHGKSLWLCNAARAAIEAGHKVVYVTTEMSELDIMSRIAQSLYKVSDIKAVAAHKGCQTGELEVVKIHPHDWTTLNIESLLDKMDDRPDLLVIDYSDELLSATESENLYQAQGQIYSGLKKLCEKYRVPILTATQTNRKAAGESGGTKAVFGQDAVSDSAKKTAIVDVLLSISWEPKTRAANQIGLYFAKNRHGESGSTTFFSCDLRHMRIDELPAVSAAPEPEEEDDRKFFENAMKKENV